MNSFETIQDLLRTKAELQARLNLIPYFGTVEIKTISGSKYIYIRKRAAGKVTSNYIGAYSEELYNLLLSNVKNARVLSKAIQKTEKQLAILGYTQNDLSPAVVLNIDFARANMKTIIYNQAVLEGCATTFPDTETIIENGKVSNVSPTDVQKILNLKHAWEFILDKDVIQSPTDFYVAAYVARLVNEGFYLNGGRLRGVPVTIGGSAYFPPIPMEADVKDDISAIVNAQNAPIDSAIELALYVMKTQIFNDGNKRAAIIFANHFLIARAGGILVVPEASVYEFKQMLVRYYEGADETSIKTFLKTKCWKTI